MKWNEHIRFEIEYMQISDAAWPTMIDDIMCQILITTDIRLMDIHGKNKTWFFLKWIHVNV